MLSNLNGWHAVLLLVVILLLFGAPRLPGLARSIGQSIKILRGELSGEAKKDAKPSARSDDSANES